MSVTVKYKLDIIVPFHGDNTRCLEVFKPPEKFIDIMRTIFVYDGPMLSNHRCANFSEIKGPQGLLLWNEKASGAGGSRNIGLAASTAELVIFADSDDYIDFEALKLSIDNAASNEITYCISESKYNDLSGAASHRNVAYNDAIQIYRSAGNKETLKNIYVPWSKIFNRQFLLSNNVQFSEVEASNDVMFSITGLVSATSIGTSSLPFYTVIDSHNSLTKNVTKSSVTARYFELLKFNLFLRAETDWALHPMSAQIFLCFRVSFLLGIWALIHSLWHRLPIFYGLGHVVRVFQQRGFNFLK